MMNLGPYEILSHVIPGFIIYAGVQYAFPALLISDADILPSIAIAFLIGYYVNILSGLLEGFYFWTWGGKPSVQLLNGKSIWKVKYYELSKTLDLLKKDYGKGNPDEDALFGIAMRVANNSTNERLKEFNSSYAVARGILTCVLILGVLFVFRYPKEPGVYILGLPLLWASWFRAKQRGAYYAREVLGTYLDVKTKPQTGK